MRVECVGPEASGTRWLTALVSLLGVEAVHRSVPYGVEWWPDFGPCDRSLLIHRERTQTIASQVAAGHLEAWDGWDPEVRYDRIERVIGRNIQGPLYRLYYEDLCNETDYILAHIAGWLGVEPVQVPPELAATRKFPGVTGVVWGTGIR